MADNLIPPNFDWVKARASCSLHCIFTELELGAQNDIQSAKSLLDPRAQTQFLVAKNGGNLFSVTRVRDPLNQVSESVNFVLDRTEIKVHDDDNKLMFSATVTLNNSGECELKVGDEELDQWQFRRKALESLFFGT